jgi:ferredoxin-nitrite reductase
MNESFSVEQQEYLKGFMAGVEARRGALGLTLAPGGGAGRAPAGPTAAPDPSDLQRAAQDAVIAAGGKLTAEEEAKRRKHPLDRYDEIAALAAEGKFPRGTDILLTKFHGLFYVAPAQDSFMCRLRIPGGILTAPQLRGVAAISVDLAGGYADITTRANLQLREIPAANAPEILIRLSEIGLTSRGSGADNVRNITGSPTAGIDKRELIDTRPHTRALHHFILHHRELYGLPRKFNIAFDGGGAVAVLEDTNDIAFSAVQVRPGFGADEGVYYRLALGGITGHKDFARPCGVLVPPADTIRVAEAILRVFIREGDRTNRAKARLKYVLDRWGLEKFLREMEAELGRPLLCVNEAAIETRPAQDRLGHVGVHAQRQAGLCYIGVLCPQARLTAAQLRGLADVAERFGSGTIRLTVWQNLLISDIREASVDAARAAIAELGLATEAGPIRAGLVACTGNAGCKFSASDTKGHASAIAAFLEARIAFPDALNIHLTGCHHSCAQHFIADIGLLGAKVERGEDMIEGYDLHVGGGAGAQAAIGRLIRPKVPFADLPPMLLALLRAWRESGEARFQDWSAALDDAALRAICEAGSGATAQAPR